MCTRDNLEVIWEEWMAEYECGVRGCVRVAYLTLTSPDNKSFYLCRRHARELTRTLKKQTRRIRRGKRRVVIGGNGTMSATTGNIEVGWDEEWLPDMPCDERTNNEKGSVLEDV